MITNLQVSLCCDINKKNKEEEQRMPKAFFGFGFSLVSGEWTLCQSSDMMQI